MSIDGLERAAWVPDRRRGSRAPDDWILLEAGWEDAARPFGIPVEAIRRRLEVILDLAEAARREAAATGADFLQRPRSSFHGRIGGIGPPDLADGGAFSEQA